MTRFAGPFLLTQLTNLALPGDFPGKFAQSLNLNFNEFTDLSLPGGLNALSRLHLRAESIQEFHAARRFDSIDLSRCQASVCSLTYALCRRDLSAFVPAEDLSKDNLEDLTLPIGM